MTILTVMMQGWRWNLEHKIKYEKWQARVDNLRINQTTAYSSYILLNIYFKDMNKTDPDNLYLCSVAHPDSLEPFLQRAPHQGHLAVHRRDRHG